MKRLSSNEVRAAVKANHFDVKSTDRVFLGPEGQVYIVKK